jgi:hypothetical protein
LISYLLGASGSNRLSFVGRFSLSGNNVRMDGMTIGRRNADGGVGTNNLSITFNSAASAADVQLLLRSIRFRTINGVAGERRLSARLTDGDGGTSETLTRRILAE